MTYQIALCVKVLLPEKTLPGGEIGAFKQCVFQDALHTAKSLDHVRTVVVQIPQFAIVPLVGPPERVLLQHLHSNIKTWLIIIAKNETF